MTYKFTQPVSMLVNDEQFIEISKELKKIGYINDDSCRRNPSGDAILYTNAGGDNNQYSSVGSDYMEYKYDEKRIYIYPFNKSLFLHLAALNDDVQYYRKGELCFSSSLKSNLTVNGIAGDSVQGQHKASKEEILAYYKMKQIGNDVVSVKETIPEFIIPEKWAIERNEENYKVVNRWFEENGSYSYFGRKEIICFPELSCPNPFTDKKNIARQGYTLISFEQFLTITQKQKEMEQEEIIGYKLIKPEYVEAACVIEGYKKFGHSIKRGETIFLEGRQDSFERLRKAEVLEKWFEPVYAVKEVVMSIPYNEGELKILIKNKGHIEIAGESVVNIEDLRKFLNEDFHKCKTKVGGFDTVVKISHISVGCKKDISIEDVRKVVLAHDELFNI